MPELTDSQVHIAALVFATGWPTGDLSEERLESLRATMRLVAPNVQFPLTEPSDEEEFFAVQQMRNSIPMIEILRSFIRQRNVGLTPKPPDPRRQKILDILVARGPDDPKTYEVAADAILDFLNKGE